MEFVSHRNNIHKILTVVMLSLDNGDISALILHICLFLLLYITYI